MKLKAQVTLKPAVVGMGYVGLPLAIEMAKKYDVVGFDIDKTRINELKSNFDSTNEITAEKLSNTPLKLTSQSSQLADRNIYIVAVPTPIDRAKNPDLSILKNASDLVGKYLNIGDVVVYESTVYPGASEEICVPVLEASSGLEFNVDFFVGYSPERINPGDKLNTINNILKVTSGSNEETALLVDEFYASFIDAGTYKAESIRVAEAAKVIENTQRDVNIALINELSILFDKLGIDTTAVLNAAGTKWNFLNFVPGLVGGHCIGVDPYYLTHKAKDVGLHPDLILAGRRVNDYMPKFVADKLLLSLIKHNIETKSARILIMGVTFKENCPDLRNSKVIELAKLLENFGLKVDIFDPNVSACSLKNYCGMEIQTDLKDDYYDAIVLAVKHDQFQFYSADILRSKLMRHGVIFDLKNTLPRELVDISL